MHRFDSEVPKDAFSVHAAVMLALKVISFILWWCIVPFVPLFLVVHRPVLFYTLLVIYVGFFLVLNRIKMHYPWLETIVFIAFFLFCVILFKSLIDYQVIEEKHVITTAMTFGSGGA